MARAASKAVKTPNTKKTSRVAPKGVPAQRIKAGKADGDAPVRAFIASLDGWKRDLAQRFDELIGQEVPKVRRAIRWSVPMYGVEGQGWFASFGAFKEHVKLNFFQGALLKPPVPTGTSEQMRGLDLRETDTFDEKLVASWIRQASRMPGWGRT